MCRAPIFSGTASVLAATRRAVGPLLGITNQFRRDDAGQGKCPKRHRRMIWQVLPGIVILICLCPTMALAEGAPTVAVVPFSVSGEKAIIAKYANLGDALAEMLATDLPRIYGCAIVERAKLKSVLDEQDLQIAFSKPDAAVKAGKMLGATHLALGAIVVAEDALRIDLHLVLVSNAKQVAQANVQLPISDLFSASPQLAAKMAVALGLPSRKAAPKVKASLPQVQAYLEAIALADKKEFDAARRRLAREMSDAATNHYLRAAIVPALYNAALQHIQESRLVKARLILSDLVSGHPTHPLAPEGRKLLATLAERIPLAEGLKDVQGLVPEDTVWPRSKSPIMVTGNVKVPAGVTLAIESGTQVLVSEGKSIVVEGRILAVGGSTLPIVFSPAKKGGIWEGIKIVGDPRSRDKYKRGSPGTRGWGYFENCRFEAAKVHLDLTHAQELTVTRCTFMSSPHRAYVQSSGTTGEGIAGSGKWITVEDTLFSDLGRGLRINSSTNGIIRRVVFRRCRNGIYGGRNLRVERSVFSKCLVGIMGVRALDAYQCAFVGIKYTAAVLVQGKLRRWVSKTFEKNPDMRGGKCIDVSGGNVVVVSECLFQDSDKGVGGGYQGTRTVQVRGCSFVRISDYVVRSLKSGQGKFDFTNNWWGTTDSKKIGSLIQDFNDDADLRGVNFLPIATQAIKLDLPDLNRFAEKRPAKSGAKQPKPKPGPVAAQPKPKPAKRPRTREEQARARLALANTYLASGLTEKGRQILTSLVAKYPETKSAQEAKKILEKMTEKGREANSP